MRRWSRIPGRVAKSQKHHIRKIRPSQGAFLGKKLKILELQSQSKFFQKTRSHVGSICRTSAEHPRRSARVVPPGSRLSGPGFSLFAFEFFIQGLFGKKKGPRNFARSMFDNFFLPFYLTIALFFRLQNFFMRVLINNYRSNAHSNSRFIYFSLLIPSGYSFI